MISAEIMAIDSQLSPQPDIINEDDKGESSSQDDNDESGEEDQENGNSYLQGDHYLHGNSCTTGFRRMSIFEGEVFQ